MGATKKGIFHDLKESEYTISNTEIVFFFSSKLYRKKFMDEYETHRNEFNRQAHKLMDKPPLNLDMLADISLYRKIEKRGFYVWMKEVTLDYSGLHRYALRKMTEKNSLDWSVVTRPKLHERLCR